MLQPITFSFIQECLVSISKFKCRVQLPFLLRRSAPDATPGKAPEWTFSSAALSLLIFLLHFLWLALGWLGAHVWKKAGAAWRHFRKAVEPKPLSTEGGPPKESQKSDTCGVDSAPATRSSTPVMAPPATDTSVRESEVTDPLPNPANKLELKYDRSKLASPVDAASTATGGPVYKTDPTHPLTMWTSPNISASHQLVSWSSRLARNYYHLHLTLLVVTALVNLWLMSFRTPGQVGGAGGQYSRCGWWMG